MDCSKCSNNAVINISYMDQPLCAEHFKKFFEKRVRKTCKGLISHNDEVGVAVSGGKDSGVMLELLSKKTDVEAILIDEGIEGYRDKNVRNAKKVCKKLEVPLHLFSFEEEYGFRLEELEGKDLPRGLCSYCGVLRRGLLNEKSRELGFDKLAIGHNLDDESQTGLMNFIRGEFHRIARMGKEVGVTDDKDFVPRIKPLRRCPEKEIVTYGMLIGLEAGFDECPYVKQAYRADIRDSLNDWEEKYPGTKFSILNSCDELAEMAESRVEGELNECSECGEPCAKEKCQKCSMLEEVREVL